MTRILETDRLYKSLQKVGWTRDDCDLIAPLTEEINMLKKEQDAVILAHSYQTPDIMYGVGDYLGDSFGLSKLARDLPQKKIIFCSVHFMGETAKLLNPNKDVLVPARAGCSLAESITPEDVRMLRLKYPSIPVICYVNTSAAVKAECDICCTSANALEIVESVKSDEVIFIPDEYMAKNLQKLTKKTIHHWTGRCIVHEEFDERMIDEVRKLYPDVKVLAHTECSPSVAQNVDYAGGTTGMIDYIENSEASTYMLATECGLVDRIKIEKSKTLVGACSLCPYMKKIQLKDILLALKSPREDQIISIPNEIAIRARLTLTRMFEV